ncbi:Os08g0552666, partial [Oryza sativa Japonica Group]
THYTSVQDLYICSLERRQGSHPVVRRAAKKAQRHIRRITGGGSSKPAASEAREIAVAALETAAAKLLPKQIATMSSSSRWSQLVSKKKRDASCEESSCRCWSWTLLVLTTVLRFSSGDSSRAGSPFSTH